MHEGEVVGLTGLLGSGFEEVPYLLYGARQAAAGSLTIHGIPIDLTRLTPAGAVAVGLALIPADRKTDGSVQSLPVVENVALSVLDRYWSRVVLDRRRMRRETGQLMREFDVRPDDPSLPYGALSGGNQQKALLAKWFQTEPRLLLLDEPTQGVDVGARQQIYEQIRTAAQERGMHVLCASSDYEQLASLCDRVVVFGRGRVWRELVGAEVTKDRIIEQSYAAMAAETAGVVT
jgi:ribose transport system ATP-binding protein